MSLQQFDILLANVEKAYPDEEIKRLSRKSRKRGIGARTPACAGHAKTGACAADPLQDVYRF